MHQLAVFHQIVSSLFNHIGLAPIEKTCGQQAFSLTIDNHFRFYLGLINQFDWYIFTDLGHINELTQKILPSYLYRILIILPSYVGSRLPRLMKKNILLLWVRLLLYEINEYEIIDIFELLLEKLEQCVAENNRLT